MGTFGWPGIHCRRKGLARSAPAARGSVFDDSTRLSRSLRQGVSGHRQAPKRGRQDRHKTGTVGHGTRSTPMTHQLIALTRPLQVTDHATPVSLPAITAYPQTQGSSVALSVALRYLATRRALKRVRQ